MQKILERHTGKAQNQGTTKKNQSYWTLHTAESANVKVLNIERGKYVTSHVAQIVNTDQLHHCALKTWFGSNTCNTLHKDDN